MHRTIPPVSLSLSLSLIKPLRRPLQIPFALRVSPSLSLQHAVNTCFFLPLLSPYHSSPFSSTSIIGDFFPCLSVSLPNLTHNSHHLEMQHKRCPPTQFTAKAHHYHCSCVSVVFPQFLREGWPHKKLECP